jgi:hypothetical protein
MHSMRSGAGIMGCFVVPAPTWRTQDNLPTLPLLLLFLWGIMGHFLVRQLQISAAALTGLQDRCYASGCQCPAHAFDWARCSVMVCVLTAAYLCCCCCLS